MQDYANNKIVEICEIKEAILFLCDKEDQLKHFNDIKDLGKMYQFINFSPNNSIKLLDLNKSESEILIAVDFMSL